MPSQKRNTAAPAPTTPATDPTTVQASVASTLRPYAIPQRLTTKHASQATFAGHMGAHQREICPEALRAAEFSAAGQAIRQVHLARSETSGHKTRPTGRLVILTRPAWSL